MRILGVLAVIVAAVLLEGCYAVAVYNIATADESWSVRSVEVPYDNQNQARIRIYGGRITKESTCNIKPPLDIKRAADTLTAGWQLMATGTLAESLKSISVGMPRPQRIAGRFEEDVVPANAPTTVKASIAVAYREYPGPSVGRFGMPEIVKETTYCTPPPAYFYPKPGVDYEVNIRKLDGLNCEIYLQQLGVAGEVEADNLPLFVGSDCND